MKAIYLCRLCRKTFEVNGVPNGDGYADVEKVLKTLEAMPQGPLHGKQCNAKTIVRDCGDHIGVCDIVGFPKLTD